MNARTLVVTGTSAGVRVEVDRPTIFVGRLAAVAPTLGTPPPAPTKEDA